MPTGIEMLVSSIFRAAGVDAEKAKEDIANYGRQLGERIAAMDASLVALREDQGRLYAAVMDLMADKADSSLGEREQVEGRVRTARPVNGEEKQHA